MKIGIEVIKVIYENAKKLYRNEIGKSQALDNIEAKVKVKRGSANTYLIAFDSMIK